MDGVTSKKPLHIRGRSFSSDKSKRYFEARQSEQNGNKEREKP
jgi:hypothetical protein